MNIAYFCVFIASVLPVFFIAYAKFTGGFKLGYNKDPRHYLAKLEGKAWRAKCAHDNSWEAFAPFAAAVIMATHTGVSGPLIDKVAMTFVTFRVLYGLSYIYDLSTIRSILWAIPWFSVIFLFYKSWSV